jgi:hypothetical protein
MVPLNADIHILMMVQELQGVCDGVEKNLEEECCHAERECCLLVLNLVSSTLPCIRQPGPRLR